VAAYYYKNGSEYRLLVMLVAAVVFFDKFWQYLFFACMLCIAFVFVRMNEAMAIEGMTVAETVGNILKIFIPLLLFVMSLFYFKHIYFKNLRALETTNHQLFVAKEDKERILHTVAHDLRSPISNITGLCNIMLSNPEKLTADQKELIGLILQSTDTSIALINNLLQTSETSGPGSLLQPVDLGLLLNKSISLLRLTAAEKMIRIETDITVEKISIKADAKRIERVITNLVNNAIKFSPERSVINIQLFIENGNAVLVVTDQGIGIPKENHEKIFEMFTKARRTGTSGEKSFGMGLSICKQIVEEHGGTIMLESEPQSGSAFIVSLPLSVNHVLSA
jgi:signal transduction histidine kinase